MAPKDSPATPIILVLAVGMAAMVMWGATPVATKLGAAEIDPLAVGMLRTLLAAVITAPLALALRVARPRTGRDSGSCKRGTDRQRLHRRQYREGGSLGTDRLALANDLRFGVLRG